MHSAGRCSFTNELATRHRTAVTHQRNRHRVTVVHVYTYYYCYSYYLCYVNTYTRGILTATTATSHNSVLSRLRAVRPLLCTETVYCSHLKKIQLQAVELVRCDSFCQVARGVRVDALQYSQLICYQLLR
eukprot:7656-Heterococcus_DN1.PRE.1